MINENWLLILDPPLPGSVNMARDEALQQLHARGLTRPTLRLYAWQPACLSLGRFQRSSSVRREACAAAAIEIVRRPSGGRALLHDDELTYAIVARSDHNVLGAESIMTSYRIISLAFREALAILGVKANITNPRSLERMISSKGELEGLPLKNISFSRIYAPDKQEGLHKAEKASAACFDTPASYEVTIDGRKLIGSAQMRREQVLLQHGALPLSAHAGRLAVLLDDTPANLAQRMISLDEAAGRRIDFDELAAAVIQAFGKIWQMKLEPGSWLPEELALVEQLQHEKYENDEWTWQR